MGQVVGAFGLSHTAMMIRAFDRADPEQAGRVKAGFDEVRRRVTALRPEVFLVVGSEHFKTFFLNNFPTFCLGIADHYTGWADAGVPPYTAPGHRALGRALLEHAVERGFDPSFSEEFRLDHGFMTPLHFVRPEMDIPIVPLFQNCTVPPLPPVRRCFELGRVLREGIERAPVGRVVVLATGGLSHWVGVPQMGQVNEAFDAHLLTLLREGRLSEFADLSTTEIEREGGNGGQEIRNWATILGIAGTTTADVLVYEPVSAWATGIALVDLSNGLQSQATDMAVVGGQT